RDPVQFLLRARLVALRTIRTLGVAAIHQHGDRQALETAPLHHLCARGAGNLVIDRLFVLVAGILWGSLLLRLPTLPARQLVSGRHLAVIACLAGGLALGAVLRRADHLALGIIALRGLLHAVEIHVGRDLHAAAPGADHARDDILDLRPQASLEAGPLVVR